MFLHVAEQENDVTLLQVSDPVYVLTTSTTNVSFVKLCLVLESVKDLLRVKFCRWSQIK